MIRVGISEIKTASNPRILSCLGLGSCVGVCLYDPTAKVGGLAHILLPDSAGKRYKKPGKFADTGIEALLAFMKEEGSLVKNIKAKIVGGASMFSTSMPESNGAFCMGPKNIEAVKTVLSAKGIKIEAEDTGGSQGRTIEFHVGSGKIIIRTMTGVKEI
jgi:chemotaxis protein CheD